MPTPIKKWKFVSPAYQLGAPFDPTTTAQRIALGKESAKDLVAFPMHAGEAVRRAIWIEHMPVGPATAYMLRALDKHPDLNEPAHPATAEEFGHCIGLSRAIIEMQDRLERLRDAGPQWAAIMEHWNELTDLYEANDERLDARIKELVSVGNVPAADTPA